VRVVRDGVHDLGVVDAAQIHRGDGEVGVPELTLDNQQWDALARHLHCVGVAQLVWCEPPTHSGAACRVVQLNADSG